MRNFIAFIKRFRVFLFFALLQGITFSIYFSYLQFPKYQYLTSASLFSGNILKLRNNLTKHFYLNYNNSILQKENIALMDSIPSSFIKLDNGLVKINDTIFNYQYEYTPAIIINSTHNKRNNYFTLNVGSKQNIEPGMGVFSSNGVVGVIHNCSEHFSVVKSCLTKDINIDVMIEETGDFGLLKWDGKDSKYGTLWGISNDSKVKKGSKIITRGGGKIFPRGIIVGRVSKTQLVEGKPLWDISVKFSENYKSLQRVYIIKNLLKKEQEKLESDTPVNNPK